METKYAILATILVVALSPTASALPQHCTSSLLLCIDNLSPRVHPSSLAPGIFPSESVATGEPPAPAAATDTPLAQDPPAEDVAPATSADPAPAAPVAPAASPPETQGPPAPPASSAPIDRAASADDGATQIAAAPRPLLDNGILGALIGILMLVVIVIALVTVLITAIRKPKAHGTMLRDALRMEAMQADLDASVRATRAKSVPVR